MQSDRRDSIPVPNGLRTAGIIAAVIAALIVAIGLVERAHATSETQQWSEARSIPTVHLIVARPTGSSDVLVLPGTLEAWTSAKLYARVGGYIKAWYRDIGSDVAAGTPLGRIDTPELDQQIVQARAAVARAEASEALAKTTADRWNDLLSSNSVSKQDADEKNGDFAVKRADVQAAKADLGRLMAMSAFATVRAPFAGIVTVRNADIGDLVGPGATTPQPLFDVADVRRIRIYVNVPQAYSAAMSPGLSATLTVPDYPERTFGAHVIGTSGAINPQSGTFQVQLLADNSGKLLKPGGYAQVRFGVSGQAGTVQIPSSALVFRAQGTQVATVGPDDRVQMHSVVIGRDLGATVEITSGLARNEQVIDNPPDSIVRGELVRVAQRVDG